MKYMKKKCIRVFSVIMVLVMMLSMVSCDMTMSGEAVGEGLSDIEIANFDYGFIEAEKYNDRETTVADTKRSTELSVDTIYYCIIEFDVVARKLNDGTGLMNVLVKFDNLGVADGTTEEAGTGNVTEFRFTDAGTGADSKVSTLSYKIPSDPNSVKKIKILIRMLPVSIGESHIFVSFAPNVEGDFNIIGDDGVTKNLNVVRAQIKAPVIQVDREKLQLTWNHVENADYYMIYFADQSIKFNTGIDQYTSVGTVLSFNLSAFSEKGVEFGDVKVQACSNSTNFIKSSYSNIEANVQL